MYEAQDSDGSDAYDITGNRCQNCGVPRTSLSCGHNVDYGTWYCSMRCFERPKHSAQLLLIRGLPGSGKSTLAKSNSYRSRWPVHLEADMFHVQRGKYVYMPERAADAHRWCLETTRIALNNGLCVVVSNTFVTLEEMAPYLALGFDVAVEEMKQSFGSVHEVPLEVIEYMRGRWQELP